MSKSVKAHASEAAEEAGRSLVAKGMPLVPPWAAALAAYPLANGMHHRFGGDPATSALLTLGDVAVAGITWVYASKRAALVRAHATVSSVSACGWLTAAAIAGVTHELTNIYLIGGGVLALSWNIKHLTRNFGTGEGGSDAGLMEKIGLARAKIRRSKVEPNKVTLDLQLPPGELTAEDAVGSRSRWASVASVAANGVRITPNPDHHDRATVVIVPEDVLRDSPVYPGPSAPGGTMVQPLHLGIYEDAEDAHIFGAANQKEDRVQANTGLVGMSGAGKGVVARALVTEIGTRRESTLWVIDIVKRTQTLGCAASVIDWFATTREQAEAMIDCLMDVISARTEYLSSRNLDNWVPGCGINHLTVWIEEFAPIIRDEEKMVDITAAARSAGVKMVFSGQRFTFDNMPTSVRANIGEIICLGVKDAAEAAYALGADLVAAGADPSVWGNKKPGYLYVIGPGIPESRYTVPARSCGRPFADDVKAVEAILATYLHLRDEPDRVTAMAAGKAYAQRTTGPMVMAALRGEPVPNAGPAPEPAAPKQQATTPLAYDDDDESENEDVEEKEEQIPPQALRQINVQPVPEPTDPDARALLMEGLKRIDQPLSPAPEMRFDGGDPSQEDDPADEVSTELAERMVEDAIRAVIKAGRDVVRPKDLMPVLKSARRSRPWLQNHLKTLVKQDKLARGKEPGEYKIRQGAFPEPVEAGV